MRHTIEERATNATKSSIAEKIIYGVVVIVGLMFFGVLLCPVVFSRGPRMPTAQAKRTMDTLVMAPEDYRKEFNAFPPDDTDGSVMIWKWLCRVHKVGEMHYGPYLKMQDSSLSDAGDGNKRFLSPLGGKYEYANLTDADGRTYVLVDPGMDKKTGGHIDLKAGFVVENEKEAKDNIYSSPQQGSAGRGY